MNAYEYIRMNGWPLFLYLRSTILFGIKNAGGARSVRNPVSPPEKNSRSYQISISLSINTQLYIINSHLSKYNINYIIRTTKEFIQDQDVYNQIQNNFII